MVRRRNKKHKSKSSSDQNLARGSGNLAMWGRSRSNLSLGGRAPSMTSVAEEHPRRATSTTGEYGGVHKCGLIPALEATVSRIQSCC